MKHESFNRKNQLPKKLCRAAVLSALLFLTSGFFTACGDYNNAKMVDSAVSTGSQIRAAMASYAADSLGNYYPLKISDWDELVDILNDNGGALASTEKEAGITFESYKALNNGEEYQLIITTNKVSDNFVGKTIELTPEGLFKK